MIQIKDMFVAADNIKSISYRRPFNQPTGLVTEPCLAIKYFYDDELVEIPVRDYDEYEDLARMIVEMLREIKEAK